MSSSGKRRKAMPCPSQLWVVGQASHSKLCAVSLGSCTAWPACSSAGQEILTCRPFWRQWSMGYFAMYHAGQNYFQMIRTREILWSDRLKRGSPAHTLHTWFSKHGYRVVRPWCWAGDREPFQVDLVRMQVQKARHAVRQGW